MNAFEFFFIIGICNDDGALGKCHVTGNGQRRDGYFNFLRCFTGFEPCDQILVLTSALENTHSLCIEQLKNDGFDFTESI